MKIDINRSDIRIAVVGLGYVGLPLAIEFGKYFNVVGFDINKNRIADLKQGKDATLECTPEDFKLSRYASWTHNSSDIKECNIYIVTVPTPIDKYKRPELSPLVSATKVVAENLNVNDFVIYESTVYPGATEEVCVPLLENISSLKLNEGFYVGYSPERINPGDKEHRLTSIKKVTSGSNEYSAQFINSLYNQIITAGTYLASSIKVAEAAKVIENTQRDLNIALINELAIIFNRLGIDTEEVLKAAGTKWNFLSFRPGLVGGHCIGVDPYYLTHKAQEIGYHPEVILSGRRINDQMGRYVVGELIKAMIKKGVIVNNANVLVLGLAFKENCPDIRNTKVVDVIAELQNFDINVHVYDPWVSADEAKAEYDVSLASELADHTYDAVVCAVAHRQFLGLDLRKHCKDKHVIYDLKYLFDSGSVDLRL